MTRLRSLLLALIAIIPIWGCDLTLQDQVGLIESLTSAPASQAPRLQDLHPECATIGTLTIARFQGKAFYVVLDAKRAFYRWEATGAAPENPIISLQSYIDLYASKDRWSLWRRYGRPTFGPGEIPAIQSDSDLSWKPLQIIDTAAYQKALLSELSREQIDFFQLASSEQVDLYLAVNGYGNAQILDETYGRIGSYSTQIATRVRLKRGQEVESLEFSTPINPTMPPFVGHATLATFMPPSGH